MPDHFHIEVPAGTSTNEKQERSNNQTNLSMQKQNDKQQSAPVTGQVSPSPSNDIADSLLSKHNGWITIDGENMNRKQAPEMYQNTNPNQRTRLKPTWMKVVAKMNQSLDIERYKKFAIDLNSQSGQPGAE